MAGPVECRHHNNDRKEFTLFVYFDLKGSSLEGVETISERLIAK